MEFHDAESGDRLLIIQSLDDERFRFFGLGLLYFEACSILQMLSDSSLSMPRVVAWLTPRASSYSLRSSRKTARCEGLSGARLPRTS